VNLAIAFASALLLALALTPLAVRLAWAIGYLDHPEARKLHTAATPLLGGAVVFFTAVAGWGLSRLAYSSPVDPRAVLLMSGALVVLVLGLWDDRFGMNPLVKLVGQAAAAALLLASGTHLGLGLPEGVEFALAMIVLVALMNAVNFLDNMNGMVGGIAAITLAAFAWISVSHGGWGLGAAQLALAGACVGFLPHNYPRASIFLGDAGSLVLGYSLGASAVLALESAPQGWAKLGPLIMLGYPAFDMIFVVVNRLREGRRIYVGGKDHTNHRLASVLRCPIQTVLLLWFSTAALCASGLVVLSLNQAGPALLLSVLWMGLFLLSGLRLSSIPVSHAPSR
jgi:UDP-GlcNAc:undecaprenyl-phosphate GlcNAc-1-phosphate transferase